MGTRDTRVDAYIARAADFAQPILEHIREVVHDACPDVEEAIKWGAPHFLYNGMMCGMAAFKEHCTLSFWKGALVVGEQEAAGEPGMGQFGRITSLDELPADDVLAEYVTRAAALNDQGVPAPRTRRAPRPPASPPDDLVAALEANEEAMANFDAFSPSAQREYVEWITEARTDETRQRRLEQAVEWLSEGKPRNWKYM